MLLDKETFTAISAGIAALGAVFTFLKQFLTPRDIINIGFGFPSQNYDPGAFLDIQNLSNHKIKIRDLGFIKSDSTQFSLPDHIAACYGHDEASSIENSTLESRAVCTARFGHELSYIGGYAYTTTQKYPRIKFRSGIGLFRRLKIRLRIYCRFWAGFYYW